MPFRTSKKNFEEFAEKALETLPDEFKKYFTNISIIIEDYPSKEDARLLNLKKLNLLGLFSGVPYSKKDGFFHVPYPFPAEIILFQKNIEEICSNEKELIEEIRKTLLHEVGHYFGLSEKELRKYE
ncbi:MAG: metallopeptidase family protein [Nitrospirota bacterium]